MLLDIRRCELRQLLACKPILFHKTQLRVVIEQSLLLAHSQVHGLLAEKAQDCRRCLSCSRPAQDKQVFWRVQNVLLVGVELYLDNGKHLQDFAEFMAALKTRQISHRVLSVFPPSRLSERLVGVHLCDEDVDLVSLESVLRP